MGNSALSPTPGRSIAIARTPSSSFSNGKKNPAEFPVPWRSTTGGPALVSNRWTHQRSKRLAEVWFVGSWDQPDALSPLAATVMDGPGCLLRRGWPMVRRAED